MFISHHEMMKLTIEEHDRGQPFAPENGCPLKFRVGDKVTFVNENGCEFVGHTITRIMKREEDEILYCQGYRYYIDSDSPWFPVKESQLLPE